MAGEIKPGDRVWMPQEVVHVYPSGEIKTDDAFICPPSYVMRDHPALSAVEKLLHDEPGLAAAVSAMKADLKYLSGLVADRATVPPNTTGDMRAVIDRLIEALGVSDDHA